MLFLESFPGLWEVPIEIFKGNDGAKCSLFDELGCWKQLGTDADTYKYFKDNFERHFSNGTTSPFHMAGHLSNLLYSGNKHRRNGNITLNYIIRMGLWSIDYQCGMWIPRPGFNFQRVPDHWWWPWANWLI